MSRSSEPNSRLRSMKALLLGGVVLPMVALSPVNAQDATDEVVVTGIQQSLKAATDVKRNSARIVDAIVAEDIGKLPDNNIAEALQRVTGVSIATDFGVGESVSIRGLSQNRIELNGRTTTGDGRDGISLQDFPSSFLRSVEVVKTPTADMVEGALGGTVRMETIRPLSLDDASLAATFDYELADKTEEWAPIANISAGNSYDLGDNGRIGVIGMYSTQDRTIRQDEFFQRVKLYGDDGLSGLTSNTPEGTFLVGDQNTVQQFEEQRERTAVSLSVEWEPASKAGNLFFDYVTTERSGKQLGNSILDVGGSRTYGDDVSLNNGMVNNYTLTGAFVIPKSWSDFRETDASSIGFGGEWDYSDNIVVSGEVSIAESESNRPDSELNLRPVSKSNHDTWVSGWEATNGAAELCTDSGETAGDGCTINVASYDSDRSSAGLRHTTDATVSFSGNKVPSVIYSDANALLSDTNMALRDFIHDKYETTNDETAYRADVEFTDGLGYDFLTSLSLGFRSTSNEYEYKRSKLQLKDLYRYMYKDDEPYVVHLNEFETAHPGSIKTVSYDNAFDQHGTSGQMDLLEYKVYDPAQLANHNGTFNKVKDLLNGSYYYKPSSSSSATSRTLTGSLADNLALDNGSYRDITEDTTAFYVSADMEINDRISAVAGVRYVETDIESTIIVDDERESGSHSYDDTLPSLNVAYEIDDNSKIRFAYAKVMRRPTFSQLSPAYDVDSSILTADRGAIDLDPFRATQFDISYEHYFEDGGIFSFAVYTKDVESFLKSTTYCEASDLTSGQNVTEYETICLLETAGQNRSEIVQASASQTESDIATLRDQGLTGITTEKVANGEDGTVEGFEIGIQKQLDTLPGIWSNLGVAANYTYADSEQPNGNPLMNISENTYNAQVYWEDNGASIRLAYNYRDEYLASEQEKRINVIGALGLNSSTTDPDNASYDRTAGNNWKAARGQLDLSGSYEASEQLTVVGSITNLLGEPSTFETQLGTDWKYTEADTRMSIGLRYKY